MPPSKDEPLKRLRIWDVLGIVLLSCVLTVVLFSHFVYFGCSSKGGIRDLWGSPCPEQDILPKTLLQRIAFLVIPKSDLVAQHAYSLVCKSSSTFSSTGNSWCFAFQGISYFSTIAEWCFYVVVGLRQSLKVIRPLIRGIVYIGFFMSMGLLVGKLVEIYAVDLLERERAQTAIFWAKMVQRMIAEVLAFFYAASISIAADIQRIILTDRYPGESLMRRTVPLMTKMVDEAQKWCRS